MFLKEKHDGGFACDGYGENESHESCHYLADVDGQGDGCRKCCPLLLNGCYFKKKTCTFKARISRQDMTFCKVNRTHVTMKPT